MEMPYGAHEGEEIETLPSDYLEWIAENWDENTPDNKKIIEEADDEFQFRTKYNSHF